MDFPHSFAAAPRQTPVAHMLAEHADDPALVQVANWKRSTEAPAA